MHISGIENTLLIWQKKRFVIKLALVGDNIMILKIKFLFINAAIANARNTTIILITLVLSSSRCSQKVSSFVN